MKFHEEHCWVDQNGNSATIGLTGPAREQLGKIIYIDLPDPGDKIRINEVFGEIESTKTTSELIAPISGEVIQSHQELDDDISPLNDFPEGSGWLLKIEPEDISQLDLLMDRSAYEALTGAGDDKSDD